MIGFNNGTYDLVSKINIPITSLSINRGYGAFDFFEVINNKPFYGDRHITRFKETLKLLKLKIQFEEELATIIAKVIEQNNLRDFYIKIFSLPHEADNPELYHSALYVFPSPLEKFDESNYTKGARLLIKEYVRFLPEAKSTHYLVGQHMQDELVANKALDVLYYNGKTIQETSRGNIFIIKKGLVSTPGLDVLKGVTRSVVLDIMKNIPLPFSEKEITIDELYAADEIFVTSTKKLVVPIIELKNQTIGSGKPGVITKMIMNEFKKLKANFKEGHLE